MKIVAYILNALLLISGIHVLFNAGFSFLFEYPVFLIIACPIVNFFVLFFYSTNKK